MPEQVTREGMLCPVCGLILVMTERHGIEIDFARSTGVYGWTAAILILPLG